MAVNYDEKILSSIGKRGKSDIDPSEIKNGVFIVDPNKLVVDSYDGPFIKDRYVPQEDLVMYANITARMAPDNHILENGVGESDIVVSLGQIGVNFLNPYRQAPRDDKSGKIIFGDKKFKDKFPLLIKFINSKTPLSIQVHPSNLLAKKHHNSFGKNEMWYIMDAEKEAELIVGFNKDVEKEKYIEHLKNSTLNKILNIELIL